MKEHKIVRVEASRSYDIHIGEGLLDHAADILAPLSLGGRVMIVSDDTVAALYLSRLTDNLAGAGYECHSFVFPHGEQSKCAETYLGILSAMAGAGFDRSDSIIALGGGVVGDISGFAAATYMRGVRYVQIPTTLLSCVDSSVGGKCAIDIREGKNLVGAFWQPSAVICDVRLLDTLPSEYFSDGMAEVIKYAMIRSRELISLIEGGSAHDNLARVIEHCVSIKRDVVALDERDTGLRAILNFGHSAAHAIEAESGYEISHGRAVGIGMMMIARGCEREGISPVGTCELLRSLMDDYALPTESPYDIDTLICHIKRDKKCKGGEIELVLLTDIGACRCERVSFDRARELLG